MLLFIDAAGLLWTGLLPFVFILLASRKGGPREPQARLAEPGGAKRPFP